MQTSLNLPGFSLTTLLLPRDGDQYPSKRVLDLLDAKASAPGWKFMVNGPPGEPESAGPAAQPTPVKSGAAQVARTLLVRVQRGAY